MNELDLDRPDYHSYLLRLWGNATQAVWHASLQSTTTKEVYHFANLEALVAFLVTQLAATGDNAGGQMAAIEAGTLEDRPET